MNTSIPTEAQSSETLKKKFGKYSDWKSEDREYLLGELLYYYNTVYYNSNDNKLSSPALQIAMLEYRQECKLPNVMATISELLGQFSQRNYGSNPNQEMLITLKNITYLAAAFNKPNPFC